jgi:hypothetical protein
VIRTILVVLAVVFAVTAAACGGGGSATPPPQQQTAAPAAAPPPTQVVPPEPPRRNPTPPVALLHGVTPPTESQLGDLYDIGRDLTAIARGDANGVGDLTDDLARFGPDKAPRAPIDALVGDVAGALRGKTLTDEQTQRLGAILYTAMHAEQIKPTELPAVAADLSAALKAVGASVPAAGLTGRVQQLSKVATAARGR